MSSLTHCYIIQKFKGFPNITLAPQRNKHEVVQNLAFTSHPSVGASTLDVLSESVMDNIALNDLSMIQQGTNFKIIKESLYLFGVFNQ